MPTSAPRLMASLATVTLLAALVALPSPALAQPTEQPDTAPLLIDPAPRDALAEPTPPAEPSPETSTEPIGETPTETPVESSDDPSAEPTIAPSAEPSPTPARPTTEPAAIVGGVGFSVDHAWVDPRVLGSDGRPTMTVTLLFPPIPDGVHHVVHGTAPTGLSDLSHCQVKRPENGITGITCSFIGEPRPGSTTISMRVLSVEGHNYSASLPVTMCPLTGCSELFEVAAVQATAVDTCPGEAFAVDATFSFNVPWNASGAALGDGAPAGSTLTATDVRDGGTFSLAGVMSAQGAMSIPIVVTDEFGVEHATNAVVTAAACASLAATGLASATTAHVGLGALVAALVGVLALQTARGGGRSASLRSSTMT